jgi:CheY-like chemotaxis protein
MSQSRLNLKNITALLADRDPFTRGLIAQMLRGFGIDDLLIASTGTEAKEMVLANRTDICFLEGALPDMDTGVLIAWIRRQVSNPLRFVPIIVLSGYTQLRMISTVRDSGAHSVVRKPVAPQTLFDRICWAANFSRPFIESTRYVGPDRRFQDVAPPDEKMKRETDANMQHETNMLEKAG